MSTSSRLIDDFNAFRSERCEVSETFASWDRFVKMVSILRDLVRADREGTWLRTKAIETQYHRDVDLPVSVNRLHVTAPIPGPYTQHSTYIDVKVDEK